ncbi:SNARE associated golgi family protein [Solidesulfovibrio carbinoliphilus subsp. oakridgensis]|uniref:SNARE associated golgi family protein n=1 Tax=Solidesulfovibrio carbinoliphilus subsp. oakridgensis TaxID=694327 RepID=G7Q6L2_9BACT|nr:VTT domain-containing protein [Solidesulfovibrio carbinoliphilus]EHJ47625.1 SNARE associated golgi family protein [Solidesulfovibrio carbinoliphilus subsp. oakridgensis]
MEHTLLEPGRTCQRIERADKAAVVVDGDLYFQALDEALEAARDSVWILGWEIDSRMVLSGRPGEGREHRLGPRLNEIAAKNHVRVYILTWDFGMLFAMERQFMPVFDLGWNSHRLIRFAMDAEHPLGASHHQKIVVIDDALAFVGGLDLTKRRWDLPGHDSRQPLRVDPDGLPYPPFHDIQMAVGGPAARALGDLARERWHRSLGVRPAPARSVGAVWPESLVPEFTDIPVAIARTEPAFKGRPEVREVEALFLAAIEAARHSIYIENQYLTAVCVEEALARRLEEPDGPEIVIVLPRQPVGWLEENVMGVLQAKVGTVLGRADRHGRLGLYYPLPPGDDDGYVKVHSKLMIVDGTFLRVGSANLNNRSMGLDTECDLALESGGDEAVTRAIGAVRSRLLAEHLRVSPEELADLPADGTGLLRRVAELAARTGGMRPFAYPDQVPPVPLTELSLSLDPERPGQVDRLMDAFVDDPRRGGGRSMFILFTSVAALAVLALLWRFTPLSGLVSPRTMVAWLRSVEQGPLTPLVVVGIYVAASLVLFPVSVLIAGMALVFPPFSGIFQSLAGCLAASAVTYWLGAGLGRGTIRRLAGRRLNRLSRHLASLGVLAVMFVRLVPVAPFSIINMVAGASHLPFGRFMLGTFLGMAPGIVILSLFTDRLRQAIVQPGWRNLSLFLLAAGALLLVSLLVRKRLRRDQDEARDRTGGEQP